MCKSVCKFKAVALNSTHFEFAGQPVKR
jgi:hypothetical protein